MTGLQGVFGRICVGACRATGKCVPILFLALTLTPATAAQADSAAQATGGGLVSSGAPSSEELSLWVQDLASDEPATRQRAYQFLSTLEEDATSSIAQRLAALKRSRPRPERVRQVLTAIRHAVGSRRADDSVDIAPGVLSVLERQRDPSALQVVEPLLLLRSLERIATREAGLLIAELLDFDEGAWTQETRRAQARVGTALLPALIELRGHADAAVRRWARRGIRVLGMRDPVVATAQSDHHLTAQVLRAYANPLDFKALPVITSFLGNDRTEVREAARWSMAQFKQNAIWQLREAYEEAVGRRPEPSWTWKVLSERLYAHLDQPLIERARRSLEKGLSAQREGDWKAMERHFARALTFHPAFAGRAQMAPGFAALGAARLKADDLQGAARAYRRALRLAPDSDAAGKWRAQLAFVTSERLLTKGVVDLIGYRKALEHDPAHGGANEAVDRLSGAWGARRRVAKYWARIGAVMLLAVFGLCLLYSRRRPAKPKKSPLSERIA